MSDIRKRSGTKGITYQVRYPSKASEKGFAYKTFLTLKEARQFRESGQAKKKSSHHSGGINSVADGVEKWLEVCEKEGRDERDPVTAFTLKGYKYRAKIINEYSWPKTLDELTAPDVIEFRSWLLKNYPRSMAHHVLSSFHSMILEMVFRGVLLHDVAARVSIRDSSRYDEPVTIPSEKEGRDGRDPVTAFTLKGYKYRAKIINEYSWPKTLDELTAPDVIEFRSWLLKNYPRSMAHHVLSSFHSMILEMVFRGVLLHDVAARVSIRDSSRYDEPVTIPSEKEVMALLKAADRLANSKNLQTQRSWERYRPILYLAANSGMRPQEYLAVASSSLKNRGVEVTRAIERNGHFVRSAKASAKKTGGKFSLK